jgi:hypothetical protein
MLRDQTSAHRFTSMSDQPARFPPLWTIEEYRATSLRGLCVRDAAHTRGQGTRRQGSRRPVAAATDDPLGFLIHGGDASNLVEAAYRYARHEPGVDVVVVRHRRCAHLRSDVASPRRSE